MAPSAVLSELERLAKRLGVTVRYDPFDPRAAFARGGLCRLSGKAVIVLDERLAPLDKIAILSQALATFDLDGVYVAPFLRAHLEGRRVPTPREQRPGPSLRKTGTSRRVPVR